MKKHFKLSFLLFVLMSMMSNKASADGSCGDGVVWSLSGTNLTITYTGSGTGKMTDYGQWTTGPWGRDVTSVVIGDGVTSIGKSALYGCVSLVSIEIPNTVTSIEFDALSECHSLTSIVIPNSVTSISHCAFNGCNSVVSIVVESGNTKYDSRDNCNAIIETSSNNLVHGCKNTIIPNSVTSIGPHAFNACGVVSIEIPQNVTSIGHDVFSNNKSLTSIEIPSSVTTIDGYAFFGCNSLTNVTVGRDTPVSISSTVFTNRSNATLYVPTGCKAVYEAADYWKEFKEIKETNESQDDEDFIVFSDNNTKTICVNNWDTNHDGELSFSEAAAVAELGEVFRSNKNITSFDELQYFTGLTSINDFAFRDCSSLTSIEIPNGVTIIGGGAFRDCSSLSSIVIPNSVTKLTWDAFRSCSSLTDIVIPNSVTSIGGYTFYGCSGLQKVIVNDIAAWCNIQISADYGNPLIYAHHLYSDEYTEITNLIIPNSVTSISSNAFYGCSGLISVEIQNGVTSIGSYAFRNCTGLTSINIPSSLASIGGSAFKGCTSLTSIEIPGSVTSFGGSAFEGCTSLTSVVILNGVTSIGSSAFLDCSSLTSIEIPNSMTSIGDRAFYNCSSLTSIEIPNIVTSIGARAFYNCSSLTSIEIPNIVTSIDDYTFAGCSGLTSIEIPSSVTNIGWRAFSGCTGLTSVEIPNSVTYINVAAFGDCSSLTSIKVESGNTKYDSRNDCNAIIETSSNLLSCGCKNTVIPNSVTSICQSAFHGCSDLISIKIPKSVTSIGQSAFKKCSSLTSVKVESETPVSIESNVFTNRTNATLFVPAGSKAAYEAANYWKEFKEIVEYDANIEITMGSSGEATYSSNVDLDFTDVEGLKAYIASGFSPSTGKTTMTRVFKVPAGEGLYLKGEPGSYDIPSVPVDDIYANLLVGVPTATIVDPTDGEYTNFILSKDELNVVGFYPLSTSGTIASGKAYLHIPSAAFATARKVNMVFEDEEEEEVTGIKDLNEKGAMSNEKFFDLQGRRVANPTRGLYIKGGKKTMVK